MFVLLLILWPIAELFVVIKVAEAIGILLTIVLLAAALAGRDRAGASRGPGRVAPPRRRDHGRSPPGREVLDGALVVAGGALLIIPGFISDVIGLGLLVPPGRALARVTVLRNLRSRVVVRAGRMAGGGQGYDVDSTATDLDSTRLPR